MLRLLSFVSFLFITSFSIAHAHPGNTAADGCHYCRTNCAKWGEVEGERHCHGDNNSKSEIVRPKVTPISTPKPIVQPTPRPTIKPTPKATSSSAKCSDVSDSICSKGCTAGNDIDCCGRQAGYRWYENYGCYPNNSTKCSAVQDNSCSSMCTAGNDHDCCLKQDGYTWYDNWGCYPQNL